MNTTPSSRIALVTGAGSGIGLACANALLIDGWTVIYAGRRLETLGAAIAHGAAAANLDTTTIAQRTLAVQVDVTDADSVAALFKTVRARFGRLDLLFNNAGVFVQGAAPDQLALEAWRRSVDTNLNGAFYCLAQAFQLMRQQSPQGGRVINNGSISAHTPRPGSVAYTTTKHAITGLTKAAALDGRALGIAVGQIDIGNVASDMSAAMAAGIAQPDGSVRVEARMDMHAVTDTFMAMARLPLSANVLFMTVMATQMPFVGRG